MEELAEPSFLPSLQCLKAEDIASAVTFVLSAPPHVQVLKSLRPSAFVLRAELLIRVSCPLSVWSDRGCADEASGTGLVAAIHGAAGGADRRAAAASP